MLDAFEPSCVSSSRSRRRGRSELRGYAGRSTWSADGWPSCGRARSGAADRAAIGRAGDAGRLGGDADAPARRGRERRVHALICTLPFSAAPRRRASRWYDDRVVSALATSERPTVPRRLLFAVARPGARTRRIAHWARACDRRRRSGDGAADRAVDGRGRIAVETIRPYPGPGLPNARGSTIMV